VLGAGRLNAVALAAVLCCGAVAACGDDGADDPETELDPDDAGGATDTTEADPAAAAVEAYEANWLSIIAAGDPADPEAAELAEHATGDNLANTRSMLGQYAAEGVAIRGSYEFDARAADVTDESAVVEDCGLDQMQLVVVASGEVVQEPDGERDGLVADMVLEDGAWKVSSLRDAPEVCE
jgi:hypothetical protein